MDGREGILGKFHILLIGKKCMVIHFPIPANQSQRIWEIQYSKKKISSLHKRFSDAG